ncbi:MAG UNVERIFIED_CONTAM: hypothetical protein LVT10_18090 [Anaerolineae bacterium]
MSVTDKSLDTRHMASLNEATLAEILQTPRDALVAMLDNDAINRQVCQVAIDCAWYSSGGGALARCAPA